MKILLYEKRTAKGISLRELSAKTNISKSTLSRYEQAENEHVDIKKLEIIARELDCRISDLYESERK